MADEVQDVMWFVDRALDGMAAVVAELGDEGANVRLHEGANSPYCLLTHCLGVLEFWGGFAIAGRDIVRDRAAEFLAEGPTAPLLQRVPLSRARFVEDLAAYEPESPPRSDFEKDSVPEPMTQRGCLVHVLEELAQHHGQVETMRDLIVRAEV